MKSFGIWFLKEDENPNDEIKIDLHINLWNIENKNKVVEPFIDFGLIINNYKSIKTIKFFFPFHFTSTNLIDLHDKVKNEKNARMIFNDNSCDISSRGHYSLIKNTEDKKDKVMYRIKDGANFVTDVNLEDYTDNVGNSGFDKYTCLDIGFKNILADDVPFDTLYMRFRIETPNLKPMLFCKLKKKNWFLESGFEATQIIDLKINKERNLPKDFSINLKRNKYIFMEFDKVHFLVMDHANNDVDVLESDFFQCRSLEKDEWNDYLDNKYNTESVLVYHWKCTTDKSSSGKFDQYSKLVKITSAVTNKNIILIYILIAIVLGAAGNIFYDVCEFILSISSSIIQNMIVKLT